MNCLLYCIIYDLLSLPSRPSLETPCWLARGKSGGGMETIHLHYPFSLWFLQSPPSISCSIIPPSSLLSWCFFSARCSSPPPEGNAAFPNVVYSKQLREWNYSIWGVDWSQGCFHAACARTFPWRCGGRCLHCHLLLESGINQRKSTFAPQTFPSHRSGGGQQPRTRSGTMFLKSNLPCITNYSSFLRLTREVLHHLTPTCSSGVPGLETKWIQEAETTFRHRWDHRWAGGPAWLAVIYSDFIRAHKHPFIYFSTVSHQHGAELVQGNCTSILKKNTFHDDCYHLSSQKLPKAISLTIIFGTLTLVLGLSWV